MTSLLMATMLPPCASDELADAEPVLVECDGMAVTLVLVDGERLVVSREELLLAVADPRPVASPVLREATRGPGA